AASTSTSVWGQASVTGVGRIARAFTPTSGSETAGHIPRQPTTAGATRFVRSTVSPPTTHKDTVMPQEPKRTVAEFRPFELRNIVSSIQRLLWMDCSTNVASEWNADKEWECVDLLSYIATELEDTGLK